jgi:hypothetical protein
MGINRWSGRWTDGGQMHDECLVLLCYMEKHRWERHTIRGLAEILGIPKSSLYVILEEAYDDKVHSLLFRVALAYGFDFKVFFRPSSNESRVLIDVVRFNYTDYEKEQIYNAFNSIHRDSYENL